ncbi:MAG: hypothetical protein NT129_06030 [Candidatus Aenigmarchaeota archaeon]|nr:hypothetical protein [Candidatus Aenigmarchaeota archaeon]
MGKCYKCGKETPYQVVGSWGTYEYGDSQKEICNQHLLEGALAAYKDALKIDPKTPWVRVHREMTEEEIKEFLEEYKDSEREPPKNILYTKFVPELTERANDIIRLYRIKHGTLPRTNTETVPA